jgi:hypothetical protein
MELEAKHLFFTHLSEEALEKYAFGRLPAADLPLFEAHLLHCEHCQERLEAEDNFVEAMRVLEQMNAAPSWPDAAPQYNGVARPDIVVRPDIVSQPKMVAPPDVVVEAQDHPDQIVAATSPALSRFWTRAPPSTTAIPPRGLASAWGVAFAAVLVAGILVWRVPLGRGVGDNAAREAQVVTLTTLRGGGSEGMAEAKAGQALDLSINIAAIANSPPGSGPYRLEMVDASGDQRWTGVVSPVVSSGSPGDAEQSAAHQISARVDKPLGSGTYWVRLYAPSGKLLREFGLHLD